MHLTRVAALPLAIVMLASASAACGRSTLDGPAGTPGDASTLDAAVDAKGPYAEAGLADSLVGPDQGAPTDSSLEDSPSRDAAERPDANPEASTSDADDASDAPDESAGDANAADASEGGVSVSACDECARGDQQCGPQVCTSDDGDVLHCASESIWTCVVGDAGCAIWDEALSCRSDVPCCVPCMHEFDCPVGSLGDPCEQDTDCAFDACDAVTHECVSDPCGDHRQDGQESDVDCGGPICTACLTGQRCQSNFDCQSGHLCGPSHLCE